MVGCTNGVAVKAPSGSEGALTVCAGGDCKQARLVGSSGWVAFPDMAAGETVTVTMVMSDGSRYTAEGKATTLQPNGPDCEPTCVIARLTLARADV